ncbi:MAG: 23S rRNA (adenine(2503)-C(2))-methyltransferase RlmN [Planctomycetota bacterium]
MTGGAGGGPAGRSGARPHLLDLPPAGIEETLQRWLGERGEPRYRAEQIFDHLRGERATDLRGVSNLPGELSTALRRSLLREPLALEEVMRSGDGTRKYRFRLEDGAGIESVWIPSGARGTLCISSQAGCPAGCTFCATGASGFRRNLRPSEIVGQWLQVRAELCREGAGAVTQVVYMGMGEPLYNYAAVAISMEVLTAPGLFRMSPRRLTVSTVGIPPRMVELAGRFPQARIALSLHSARDRTRSAIVPVNRRYPVEALRETLLAIADSTRRVTLECVILAGVNDSPEEARALARFARGSAGHVNLLPFHPHEGSIYRPPRRSGLRAFRKEILREYPGRVTIRRSRGLDIDGACGQLALNGTPRP